MINALNSALSGLNAASNRLGISADNVANQFSTDTLKDGALTGTPPAPQDAVQASLSGGGVQVSARERTPATTQVFAPENPAADEAGFLKLPNTDLEEEAVTQILAKYDFKANLKTLDAADDVLGATLDILG